MAWLAGYGRRQPWSLASNAIGLSGSLSDFTSSLKVPSGNPFWNNAPSDGRQIRLTAIDGVTLLDFELEAMVAVGERGFWEVKNPTLSHTGVTQGYLYYVPAVPSNGDNKEGSWDANYKASYRLNQDKPEGAFDDSTSNNNDLANTGTTDGAGQIDRGRNLDGIDDDLRLPDDALNALSDGTMEFWVNNTTNATTNTLFTASLQADDDNYVVIQINTNGKVAFAAEIGNVVQYVGTVDIPLISDSTDTHIIWAKSGSTHKIYIDGDSKTITWSNVVDKSKYISDISGTTIYTVGNLRRVASLNYYKGILDEITISDSSRSDDWDKARYQSGLGIWLSFGAEELEPTGIARPLINGSLINTGLIGARL